MVSTVPLRACSSGVAGEMTQILQPPPELNLQAGEHPVIAFMTFSQYPAYGEIVRDSSGRCSVDWSDEGEHTFKDKPFMVVDAELIYRQALALPSEPSASHPRLFGSDDAWMSQRVRPFLEAPCEPLAQGGVGWFEDAGVADVKGHFELSARGFRSSMKPRRMVATLQAMGLQANTLSSTEAPCHHTQMD